jgi:ABC-type lipoprotein release transport system permease subunit
MGGFLVNAEIGARNLVQHGRRSLLLGGAIAAVTALFLLLIGISTSMRETMLRSATTLMTGHVNIGGFYKVTSGQSAPVITGYEKILATAKAAIPEVKYTVHRGRGWAKLVADNGNAQQAGIGGIDITHEPGFREVVHIQSGNIDDLAKPGTILIFEDQAKRLDVKVGDALTISAPTTKGVNNTIDVRVVAIADNIGLLSAFNVYIPEVSLRALYQLNADSTGVIYLYLDDVKEAGPVAAKLRTALDKAGYRVMEPDSNPFWQKFQNVNREDWTGQKLDVTTWDDEISFLTWILNGFQFITLVLVVILTAIVVVGIMNTMWIAIRERTREIGTLRAIGMQRGRVMQMFLVESGLLGLIGSVVGAIVALTIAASLNAAGIKLPNAVRFFLMSEQLAVIIHAVPVIEVLVGVVVVTSIAAYYPSYRASRLQPVTAMHHAG